jgi:hypothetical protein
LLVKPQLLVLVGFLGIATWAFAQEEPVERTVKGPPDKAIRLGVYVNIKPDCSSGPLPTIRLITQPAHGKVSVKKGNVSATNFKQCLALEVPGYVAFYRSAVGFAGTDGLVLEVKFPGGRTVTQKFTVMVAGASFGL